MARIIDISTTSGTTGLPTVYPLTARDLDRLGTNEQLSFSCANVTPDDVALLAVTMDRCFIAGLAYFEGLRKLGATTIRVGSGPPAMLLSFLDRLRPTLIVSVPSFLKKVALYAADHGVDLARTPVSKLVCIGEPVRDETLQLTDLGRQISHMWGAQVYSTYGITELAVSFCECSEGRGGHLHPELVHVEILDDEGRPVPDGEVGEIVATTLGVEAMPLLRFRTGDRSFLVRERCPCGRWTPRIGPILGRKGQVMKLKGTTVYPAAVQRVLDGMDDVSEYVMIVSAPTPLSDELEIWIALKGASHIGLQRIEERLQAELKVKPLLKSVQAGEIEALRESSQCRKKRTLIDQRMKKT